MDKFYKFPGLALALLALCGFSGMKKTLRVVFFGDSITEAAVYPGGYIAQMRDTLDARRAGGDTLAFELIGAGIGGNKIYDLYLRLEEDVLARQPDVVVVYVGVNDVWHKRLAGTGTDPDKFERFYAALIRKLQLRNIRVVLCTPACIGEKHDCSNAQDGEINAYANIVRDLAKNFGCGLCDLRQAFLAHSARHNPENRASGILTTDGVHLNETGNRLVAEMLLGQIL
jgi:lysophospholipase L1-like esterase